MSVTLDLTPDEERRLAELAAQRGQTVSEFARAAVIEKLETPDSMPSKPRLLPDGLPPRDPAELLALVQQQGVKPFDFDAAAQAEVWPEDEAPEEFLAARREWQRQGGPGFRGNQSGSEEPHR